MQALYSYLVGLVKEAFCYCKHLVECSFVMHARFLVLFPCLFGFALPCAHYRATTTPSAQTPLCTAITVWGISSALSA